MVDVYVVHGRCYIQLHSVLTRRYDALYVGCFRLIKLEIPTAANPSHGDTQLAPLGRQTLRRTLDYRDCDCFVVLRKDLRELVSAWRSRTPCAVKIGLRVRTACSRHFGVTWKLMISANA